MNRLKLLFGNKDRNILSVYFTAGFPEKESTVEIICELEKQGVDMIEVGVPFSDPMADGEVIQRSSSRALNNGMTLSLLLDQVAEARKVCRLPLVLMGYLNPMMQYGMEALFERCRETGIDALIIPDLPFNEYMKHYKMLCDRYDIPVIMLVTPETSLERVMLIDENCGGFIYMVSSASTTGTKERFSKEQEDYFKKMDSVSFRNRRLIGFGISNPETYETVCRYSSGGIVGSMFIKCLERNGSVKDAVSELMSVLDK
ncbi:tryptophan synthase subunit alpha [Barnesiella propionica]|uniref:tryptophan synthase subunit alpha n=1 Tax=Barnesiella propionica TaxID=2981781 RepID=UPI0011C7BE30|nr:tryptophan synthase subunit alpha [Barnesiella propionica]MCU6768403.1 tryptophan synthase subunit alpha [Barnesiella propionica]